MSGVQIAELSVTPDRAEQNGPRPALAEQLIQELFETQVELTPHAIAVVFGSQKLTYATLNRKTNQLAHYLIKSGVTVESRVGVCLDRSPEALVALLGILKAGGVYVPLDPDYPTERLNYMLADS